MILECLTEKNLIVYGTGHVAHKFYKALDNNCLQGNIRCFVRTGNVTQGELFEGIPVYCFQDVHIQQDDLICLAVHESLRDEVEKKVRQVTQQCIWIYPYLYELMLGEAEQGEVQLDIKQLLQGFRSDLRLGVRMAVIEQQDGKNTYGQDCYIKAQRIHCSRDTAQQRLKQFLTLIHGWEQSGYDIRFPISINRNYEVIDGNHRLAMAVYVGQTSVNGKIYPTNLSADEIHGQEAMLSEKLLLKNGFSEQEIQRLQETQQRYMRRYESE